MRDGRWLMVDGGRKMWDAGWKREENTEHPTSNIEVNL
jgi:hypothetical protein